MVTEVTMIGIDNSRSMLPRGHMFDQQIEVIDLYCRAKFYSNPENSVGTCTLSGTGNTSSKFLDPTSELWRIVDHVKGLPIGDHLDLHTGISFTGDGFYDCPEGMQKRMLLFVGGRISFSKDVLLRQGNKLKEQGVAVDVVSFVHGDPAHNKRKSEWLEAFVHAANKNNKSHIAFLEPGSRIYDVLSSAEISPPLPKKERAWKTNKAVPYGDENVHLSGMKRKSHHTLITSEPSSKKMSEFEEYKRA